MRERPICQLSIDRSSSAATSISITNPSINMLDATLNDGREGERYVTNVPGRGYCFVAPVSRAASPYIQHLYG